MEKETRIKIFSRDNDMVLFDITLNQLLLMAHAYGTPDCMITENSSVCVVTPHKLTYDEPTHPNVKALKVNE